MPTEDGELAGLLVSDGSIKGLEDLRHGGWAALQNHEDGSAVVQGVYGPLPFPDPSSALAEWWGLLQALRHATFATGIIIDNAQVVGGLFRAKRGARQHRGHTRTSGAKFGTASTTWTSSLTSISRSSRSPRTCPRSRGKRYCKISRK